MKSFYESFKDNLNEKENKKPVINESAKVVKEKHEPSKANLKEAFLYSRQKLKESVQGLAEIIWGSDVIADEEHMGEDFEIFKSLSVYIDGVEDSYNDGDITKSAMLREIKSVCKEKELNDEEIEKVVNFYEKSYSDSPDDVSDDSEEFTMYNPDYDKEVRVWKQDGKWYDSDGNRYMGYLTKQDVKSYFRGNYQEM